MIEVEQLVKHYGQHVALKGVSFHAEKGEILGLLGPNGAGKSTTMRILTGYMPPTGGTARVKGYDVVEDSYMVRKNVGYMPERVPIYPDMTIQGYIKYWARLRGTSNVKQRVNEVMDTFGLTPRRKHLVRSLSKGFRQRLGLAQAIVHNPDVIILDEPTIGIDPQQVIEVRETVERLRENHTVVFSSHILSEVEQICDRVVIINKGELIAEGTPELLSQQLNPGQHLYVELDIEQDKAIAFFNSLKEVNQAQAKDNGVLVSGDDEQDLRRIIATASQQAGHIVLEMRVIDLSLEDIFLNIVEG